MPDNSRPAIAAIVPDREFAFWLREDLKALFKPLIYLRARTVQCPRIKNCAIPSKVAVSRRHGAPHARSGRTHPLH